MTEMEGEEGQRLREVVLQVADQVEETLVLQTQWVRDSSSGAHFGWLCCGLRSQTSAAWERAQTLVLEVVSSPAVLETRLFSSTAGYGYRYEAMLEVEVEDNAKQNGPKTFERRK